MDGQTPPDPQVRTCCNMGYARGRCPSFQKDVEAADAVRFGIVARDGGRAVIRYVIERDHLPFSDGMIELIESAEATAAESTLERQARAFLASYLRRSA